jgi:hypothetical protein
MNALIANPSQNCGFPEHVLACSHVAGGALTMDSHDSTHHTHPLKSFSKQQVNDTTTACSSLLLFIQNASDMLFFGQSGTAGRLLPQAP